MASIGLWWPSTRSTTCVCGRLIACLGTPVTILVLAAVGCADSLTVQNRVSPGKAGKKPPVTIDSFGFWTLHRLGSGPIKFERIRHRAERSIPYILERDKAKQGPKSWYQIRLHARVLFGEGTGHAYLFTGHNGYVSALIEYEASKQSDGRKILRRAASYIDGSSTKPVHSGQDILRFRNYLQYRAVRGGLNRLTFSVETSGALELKKVEILSDSGLVYTPQGPARVSVSLGAPIKRLSKGRKTPLPVTVRNMGDRQLRNTTLNLVYAKDDIQVVGPARKYLGTLPPRSERRTSFSLVPLHRGQIQIAVSVGGLGGNQAAVSKTLNVP